MTLLAKMGAVPFAFTVQVVSSSFMTPTTNIELLLSAQLGSSGSEPSVSRSAGSRDLVVERRMGTSKWLRRVERAPERSVPSVASRRQDCAQPLLMKCELCAGFRSFCEREDACAQFAQGDALGFDATELAREHEINARTGALLVVPDQGRGFGERLTGEARGQAQSA